MKLQCAILAVGLLMCARVSAAQVPCRGAVKPSVAVESPDYTLADLLTPESSALLRSAAVKRRLGAAPLQGSPRVLVASQVKEMFSAVVSGNRKLLETCILEDVPERVVVRGAARVSYPVGHPAALRPRAGELIHSGQSARLLWDEAGIRVVVPTICLDPGSIGDIVRARLVHGNRTVRAVVVGAAELRAVS